METEGWWRVTKYVLAYRGGTMGDTPEAQAEAMTAWMNWFGELGTAMVDGGAPFGPSTTLGDGPNSNLSGYSIIEADTLDDAAAKARGCPVLGSGGSIDVYETLPVG
jgi:hypothetical protein